MATTYIKIASVAVGAGGAASMSFSSIPQNFTDLIVKLSTRLVESPGGEIGLVFQINGSSANWSSRELYGTGTQALSFSRGSLNNGGYVGEQPTGNNTANTFSNCELTISNYTASVSKSWSSDTVSENNATATKMNMSAGLWASSAAVTSLSFYSNGSYNFAQYSTATLYGIKSSQGEK